MAIGGRHSMVVALVTLLLTFAVFQGKSSSANGESVSVAGRKGLAEPQDEVAPAVLADESTTTSQDASEQQTSDEGSEEASEESSDQTAEETSEEFTEQTPEEQTSEETSTEQAFNQDFKEEVTDIIFEEFSVEVSDEPVVEEFELATEESTSEEVSTEESTTEEPFSEEFATEEPTAMEESFNAEDVQAQENVEFSTDESEETSFERTQMREMEEVMAPETAPPADNSAAAGPSTTIENPDASNYPKPMYNPDYFLRDIAEDNAMARRNEGSIQSCIEEDGCGTP